ncbi:MAG: DNA replication/repair protein RecF [Flavobacteriales bacterium]
MKILHLKTGNFRNYEFSETTFGPKFNLIFGLNGTGKTNLLDAVHYLGWTKSFINASDTQNIRRGQEFFFIEGMVEKNGKQHQLYCGFKKENGKQFRIDKKEYEKMADHIGFMPLAVISPNDQELSGGGSEERRRFSDSVISVFKRPFLDALVQYNRILLQRNALLKQMMDKGPVRKDIISIYNEQMLGPAREIVEERRRFAREFNETFSDIACGLAGKDEQAALEYKTGWDDENPESGWEESFEKDLRLGYTSYGPHKDDFAFSMHGLPLKKSASQGQQKTFLTALKLAQYNYMRQKTGLHPILLLDDIFDKLDDERVERMLGLLSAPEYGQVLITDTGSERILRIFEKIQQPVELIPVESKIPQSYAQ